MPARLLFLTLILFPGLAAGQGSVTSLSQLKIPLTARVSVLGNGTVADGEGLSSWSTNPANLSGGETRAVILTHVQWIQEIQCQYIGLQVPMLNGSFAVGAATNAIPGIELRESPGPPLASFTARFANFQAGYSTSLYSNLSVGLSAKYLYEKIYVDQATGIAFDAGIRYKTGLDGLSVGAALTDLGSLEPFRGERSDLPSFVRLGALYRHSFGDFEAVISASAASSLQQSETHLGTSLESTYRDFLTIRLGYQTGYDSRTFSAGFGIQYELLSFDYGFLPFTFGLGEAHILTLGIRF